MQKALVFVVYIIARVMLGKAAAEYLDFTIKGSIE